MSLRLLLEPVHCCVLCKLDGAVLSVLRLNNLRMSLRDKVQLKHQRLSGNEAAVELFVINSSRPVFNQVCLVCFQGHFILSLRQAKRGSNSCTDLPHQSLQPVFAECALPPHRDTWWCPRGTS